jgi:hypothetical protein
MMPRRRFAFSPRLGPPAVLVAALLAGAFVAGLAVASLTVTTSATEAGTGWAEGASAITWWRLAATAPDVVPTSIPPTLSTNPVVPTNLSTVSASYAIGTATGGHPALRIDFVEKGATPSVVFELTITFVNATAVTTQATVYLETQTPIPAGSLTFSLYLDLGGGAVAFASLTEVAQTCSGTMSCP